MPLHWVWWKSSRCRATLSYRPPRRRNAAQRTMKGRKTWLVLPPPPPASSVFSSHTMSDIERPVFTIGGGAWPICGYEINLGKEGEKPLLQGVHFDNDLWYPYSLTLILSFEVKKPNTESSTRDSICTHCPKQFFTRSSWPKYHLSSMILTGMADMQPWAL